MNTDIHFASPESWWIILLLATLAAGFVIYRWIKIRKSIAFLNKIVSGRAFLRHASLAKYTIKSILWCIGFVFLIIPLLRPQWDKKEEHVDQMGRDLFIALDISRSMLAQDVSPSRLEFAKKKIKDLVMALSCERVGLILFSGTSFISCPLTRDYRAFFMFLDQIDVESISSGTTMLDSAIMQAVQAFQSSGQRKHKLLVIVTDGENFSPTLAATKEKAGALGLTVFALGVGSEQGAPIPLYDAHGISQGHQKDTDGSIVISKLNEPLLKSLTQELHGLYVHAAQDAKDIKQLTAKLEHFEKEKMEERTIERYQEQYPWFLLISFGAFACEWVL